MLRQEEQVIANTVVFVKKKLNGDSTGHDWWHIYRVWKMSLMISNKEGGNHFIIELAALLHDIADWKFNDGNSYVGTDIINDWLTSQNVEPKIIKSVIEIINTLSFKGANVETPMGTIEGKIVQDADRLDALGAIGITRAFAYGGYKKREIYNPDIKPVLHNTFDEYKKNRGTSINHFYEKLLLLKDRMNTETAKKMAIERHHYMESFLKEFFSEWHCEK